MNESPVVKSPPLYDPVSMVSLICM
jgi:hypothetical protein